MPPKRYFDSTAKEQSSSDAKASAHTATMTTTTTKKERRGSHAIRGPQTTLFVSSLPFTATSTDLTTLFSDVGPLRRAFVVKDKDSGKSKGVGYVSFAIREDAERALADLQGRSVDGGKRKMRIEWATGRPGVDVLEAETTIAAGDAVSSNVARASTAHQSSSSTPSDRDAQAVRTIIMTGLAQCKPAADSKSIYKRARKIGDVENVIYPAQASIVAAKVSDDVAQIVYRTPNHAMTAVTKLHAHTFKGAQISVILKKRADGAAKLEAHMRPETKARREALQQKVEKEQAGARLSTAAAAVAAKHDLKPDVNRGSRLIVRNLPFDVTDRDLRAVFLPYGPIYSIDVPQKAIAALPASKTEVETASDEAVEDAEVAKETTVGGTADSQPPKDASVNAKPQGRGFAFVWHVSRSDAAKAIAGVNGTMIAHGAAEKAQLKAAKGKAGRDAAKLAFDELSKTAQTARSVAVDWALSKKDWEMKKDESEAEETDVEGSSHDDDSDDDDDDDEDEDSADDDDASDLDPMEVDEDEEDSSADEEDGDEKPALPQPEEGTTLFIRNLPYQATEEELRALFRSFGPLRYAKVTMDKATKRPKGTAFICFWQKVSADKAMQQAHLVESETGGSSALASSASAAAASKKKNPFAATSILTADPSAPLTASLSLHGRVLSVVPALDRSQADQMANVAQSAREKKDKRNTFLMREGVPMPNSALAARLPEVEIERRLTAFQVRKTQLTKNPSLFVSKTRLSVRQLPLYVTDKVLKRLGEHAVVEFDKQVKSGEREPLTADELHESRRLAEEIHANRARKTASDAKMANKGEAAATASAEVSKKQMLKTKRNEALQRRLLTGKGGFVVVQSKIIRAKDRLDATTGLGRSHGYGFLEVATFADALKIVRFANANKAVRKLMLSWYAEELGQMAAKLRNKNEASGEVAEVAAAAAASSAPKDKKIEEEKTARLRRIERKKAQLEAGNVDPEDEGTRGALLVVEFSVENVVTVKRRSERLRGSQAGGNDRRPAKGGRDGSSAAGPPGSRSSTTTLGKRDRGGGGGGGRRGAGGGDDAPAEAAPSKRPRRPDTWNQKTSKGGPRLDSQKTAFKSSKGQAEETAAPKPIKQGSVVGSIIGRKRKMRQGK